MAEPLYGSNGNAFAAAVDWLQGTLLGTIATAVAIVAVAWLGFLMLTGRIDVRRAVQVILGCFILFGATTIATGIESAVAGIGDRAVPAEAEAPPVYPATPPASYPQKSSQPFDPYAGAAVPTRQ